MFASQTKRRFKNVRFNHFGPPLEGTPLASNSKYTPRQQGQLKKASLSGPITDYYVFGSCEQGQLGLGSLQQVVFTPKRIDGLEGCDISSLSVGHNHCAATMANGSGALVWGYNGHGQLGHGSTANCAYPQRILNFDGYKVLNTICGPLQTFVMTENLATGKSAVWHIGIAYPDTRSQTRFTVNSTIPMKVRKKFILDDAEIIKIAPAGDFCIWIDNNNVTYSFGLNGSHSALGQGMAEEIPFPTPIKGLANIPIVEACTGWGHTIARSADGRLFSWGSNQHGQCGLGFTSTGVSEPAEITALKGVNIIQITCGESHSMALDSENNVYTWGSASEGKLGFDSKTDVEIPTRVEFFNNKKVNKLSGGCDHSAVHTEDDQIFVWGFGQHGALSMMSSFNNSATPLQIPPPRFRKIPEEEKLSKDLEKLSKMKTSQPLEGEINNTPFSMEHEEYPFLQNGKKIEEGEFFDINYKHLVKDVYCGMDFTILKVESSPISKAAATNE
jgi:alpha-tubulin suppressor-like RCC1 family protein